MKQTLHIERLLSDAVKMFIDVKDQITAKVKGNFSLFTKPSKKHYLVIFDDHLRIMSRIKNKDANIMTAKCYMQCYLCNSNGANLK